jgi:hypothetical protein
MIRFYYFKGCPNAGKSWENLLRIQKEEGIPSDEIEKIEVPDMETAESVSFQGSPTILIDGIDMYTGMKPEGCQFSCRVFQFGDHRTGILSADFIREKYHELQHEQQPEDDSSAFE